MLTHIHIKNYTIVESLSLDLQSGLHVLTGETGAGKSIIVDAVSLALGARADAKVVRGAAPQCDISLCFDVRAIAVAKQWLIQHDFDDADECIVRRVIHRDGRSRSTLNSHPCSQSLVREFSDVVLNIHGQHQHQALLQRAVQQQQLDRVAHHEPLLHKIKQYYRQWQKIEGELAALLQQAQTRDHQLKLNRYELDELMALNLQDNEWQQLTQQHQQLHNAEALMRSLNEAIDLTVENGQSCAAVLLQQAVERVSDIKSADSQLVAIKELLNAASIHLQEAGDELNHYRNHLDLSPENLQVIEQRLTLIHDLARKHRVAPEALPGVIKSLQQTIEALENNEAQIDTLRRFQDQLIGQYQSVAGKLSDSRVKAAKMLEKSITEKMQQLGMNGGRFKVTLQKVDDKITPYGNEKIAFVVSTNPGQDFLPLQAVVSGGELSRIGLALQVITARKEATPTLIFDEVDTGIGGKTADIVGQLLRALGEKVQVLCITHLPQVAALGHQHFRVEKTTGKSSVSTAINPLNKNERIEELARMMSGATVTEEMLTHAEAMLDPVSS